MSDSALLTGGPLPLRHKCISPKCYFLYCAHRSQLLHLCLFLSALLRPRWPCCCRRLCCLPSGGARHPRLIPLPLVLALITLLPLYNCPSTHLPFPHRCTSVSLCSRPSFPRWWLMAEGSSMEYRSVRDGWGTRSSGQSRRSQTKD